MALPSLVDDAVPPGCHPGTIAEIRTLVGGTATRAVAVDSVELACMRLRDTLGPSTVWIGGPLMNTQIESDVYAYIAYHCRDRHEMASALRLEAAYSVLSVQDVMMMQPAGGWVDKIRPVGGLVDIYLMNAASDSSSSGWDNRLSIRLDDHGHEDLRRRQGYVEVNL